MARKSPKGSGCIYKTESGKYRASYVAPIGSKPARPSKTFALQREARAWLDEQLGLVRSGKHVTKSKETLVEWIRQYVKTYKPNVAAATKEEYKYSVARIEKHCPGLAHQELQKIQIPDIQQAVNILQAEYHSRTVEITYKLIRMSLRKAMALSMLSPLDLSQIELQKEPEKRGGAALTNLELKKLLGYCRQPANRKSIQTHKDILLLIALTGMRTQEARALRDSDITEHGVHIQNALDSKGNLKPTKTERSVRSIPLPPEAMSIIKRRSGNSLSGFIFETTTGKPLSHKNITRHLQLILPDAAPHDLRHTYITNAVRNGVNLKALSALTGDSVETLLKVYAHVDSEDLMQAALTATTETIRIFSPKKAAQ